MIAAAGASVPITIVGSRQRVSRAEAAFLKAVGLSLEKFQRLEICPGRAIVGAGVSLDALQAAPRAPASFMRPIPTERTASVGGTIATNASGSRSFRYGSTRRHVLGCAWR